MINRITKTLTRIIDDLRNFKNVDAYILTLFALIFAVLTFVGDDLPPNLKDAAILGALGLLVFNLTVPKESGTTSYDEMLDDRSSFHIPFADRMQNASELYIYAPSAVNILNSGNLRAINDNILSKRRGEFKIIIQDPDKKEALNILSTQIDENVTRHIMTIEKAIYSSIDILEKFSEWERAGTFEFKLLEFNPGFSLVAINPRQSDGVVIVEFYGYFHEDTSSRMHIEITRDDSERWYEYWVAQFDRMWEDARTHQATEPTS